MPGWRTPPVDSTTDALLVHLLARQRAPVQFGNAQARLNYRRWHWRRLISQATLSMLALAGLFCPEYGPRHLAQPSARSRRHAGRGTGPAALQHPGTVTAGHSGQPGATAPVRRQRGSACAPAPRIWPARATGQRRHAEARNSNCNPRAAGDWLPTRRHSNSNAGRRGRCTVAGDGSRTADAVAAGAEPARPRTKPSNVSSATSGGMPMTMCACCSSLRSRLGQITEKAAARPTPVAKPCASPFATGTGWT